MRGSTGTSEDEASPRELEQRGGAASLVSWAGFAPGRSLTVTQTARCVQRCPPHALLVRTTIDGVTDRSAAGSICRRTRDDDDLVPWHLLSVGYRLLEPA